MTTFQDIPSDDFDFGDIIRTILHLSRERCDTFSFRVFDVEDFGKALILEGVTDRHEYDLKAPSPVRSFAGVTVYENPAVPPGWIHSFDEHGKLLHLCRYRPPREGEID